MADSRNCSWISLRKTPMFKKYKNLSDSRLKVVEQLDGSVIPLSNKAKLSLYKKSLNSGIGADILEEVYVRGYSTWNESFHGTPEQFAFDRVNSFISGGFATELDEDLMEKRGLWDNIWAKRKRIEHGSGEHMRKAGSKGAPTADALKKSQEEETSLKNIVKKTVHEELYEQCENCTCFMEDWQDSKYKSPSGGLTKAGVMAYRSENPGSKLKTAVTKKPSELKAGSKDANRRKSFCARMSGMKKRLTSAETARDPDSRINKALCKWHCEEVEVIDEKAKLNVNLRAKDIIDDHLTPNGWKLKSQKGIHDIYHHPDYKERVALPRHKGDLAPGTVRQILGTVNNKPTVQHESVFNVHGSSKHFKSTETSEPQSHNSNDPDSRFDGTTSGANVYKKATPGQTMKAVKKVIKEKLDEINVRNAAGKVQHIKNVNVRMADGSIKNLPPGKSGSSGGGGD